MRDLLGEIERAVKARGWSARQASLHAVGTPELIHDMRRGRVPSVERFRTLCQALELEFYVGPPRDGGRVDAVRLSRVLEITERALASTGRTMSHADKARAVSAVYDLMSKRRAQANATRIAELIEAVAKARAHDQATGRQGDIGDTPIRHRGA